MGPHGEAGVREEHEVKGRHALKIGSRVAGKLGVGLSGGVG